MTRLRLEARGHASPDLAWERYADLDLWSTWSPQITHVEATGRRLVPGLTGRVVAVGVLPVPFEVLEVDETARTWTWRVRVGPVGMLLDHAVHDDGPGGSRTTLDVQGLLPVVLGYAPLARLALGRLVRA